MNQPDKPRRAIPARTVAAASTAPAKSAIRVRQGTMRRWAENAPEGHYAPSSGVSAASTMIRSIRLANTGSCVATINVFPAESARRLSVISLAVTVSRCAVGSSASISPSSGSTAARARPTVIFHRPTGPYRLHPAARCHEHSQRPAGQPHGMRSRFPRIEPLSGPRQYCHILSQEYVRLLADPRHPARAIRLQFAAVSGIPLIAISPQTSCGARPAIKARRVDLPEPLGPSKATCSAG